MTQPTSSRSAKATPKTAAKRATNGTRPASIDAESVTISEDTLSNPTGVTEWTAEMSDGSRKRIRVLGSSNGRVSVGGLDRHGRDAHEVRIYRSQSIKGYDAYISGVRNIWSHNVLVDDLGKPAAIAEAEARKEAARSAKREELARKRFEVVVNSVLANAGYGTDPDEDPEFTEPEEYEVDEAEEESATILETPF